RQPIRNRLFERGWKRQEKVSVPVVSVGNLTLGGTGKTPCVEYVARFYRELGVRAAILRRGDGSEGGRHDEHMRAGGDPEPRVRERGGAQRRGHGPGREPARRAAPAEPRPRGGGEHRRGGTR